MPFLTPNTGQDTLPPKSTGKSVDSATIEGMDRFDRNAVPRILNGLRRMHRTRYPEKYPAQLTSPKPQKQPPA
jgi:hypothetical protein